MILRRSHTHIVVSLLAACGLGEALLCPICAFSSSQSAAPIVAANGSPRQKNAITLDLPAAIQQGMIQAQFRGNGKEMLRMTLTNKSSQALLITASEGQVFKSGNNSVVVVRPTSVELARGEKRDQDVQTAALYSSNKVLPGSYSLSPDHSSRLDPLLRYLLDFPEISHGAIQTAVLALTENLPLSAFATFATPGGEITSHFDTSAFKADTADIISALTILRALGFRDDQIALTIDPQLKIEAMIDPMAHAYAMRYYGIKYDQEWLFWKEELLNGNPATRHYALHGIARYYPDVALVMLPQWVRETRTEQVYRVSAVQALSETGRSEAVSVLRQFQADFAGTELSETARLSADVLQRTLDHQAQCIIAFHTSGSQPRIQNLIETLEQSIQAPAAPSKTQTDTTGASTTPVLAAAAH